MGGCLAGVRGSQGFGQAKYTLVINDIVDPPAIDRTSRQSQQHGWGLSSIGELHPRHPHHVRALQVTEYLDTPNREAL